MKKDETTFQKASRLHIKIAVITLTIIFSLSGFFHGLFEILQGNNPTPGLIINAIGENHQAWSHGKEPAFTLINNYMMTGILSIIISALITIWTIWFIDKKYGSTIYILLFIALFLTGGGIGQVLFFIPLWIFLLKINRKANTLQFHEFHDNRKSMEKWWKACLIISSVLLLISLELAMFGYLPFINDENTLLLIMLGSLLISWCTMITALVLGKSISSQTKPID